MAGTKQAEEYYQRRSQLQSKHQSMQESIGFGAEVAQALLITLLFGGFVAAPVTLPLGMLGGSALGWLYRRRLLSLLYPK